MTWNERGIQEQNSTFKFEFDGDTLSDNYKVYTLNYNTRWNVEWAVCFLSARKLNPSFKKELYAADIQWRNFEYF